MVKMSVFLSCAFIMSSLGAGTAAEKVVQSILDDATPEQQQKSIRQLFKAWDEDCFRFDVSPENDALMAYCIKRITAIQWHELSPEKEAELPMEEQKNLKTAVLLYSLLAFAKTENHPVAIKFFADLGKRSQNPQTEMVALIGKGMLADAEKAVISKSVRRMEKLSPEEQINMLFEILSNRSYLSDSSKDRFISGFAFSSNHEGLKLLQQDPKMVTRMLDDIEIEFPKLSPEQNPGARHGFIELFSKLASTEEAIKWLNSINDPNRLSSTEKLRVDSILKQLKMPMRQEMPCRP